MTAPSALCLRAASGATYRLPSGRVLLGRGPECEIRFADRRIAPIEAAIEVVDGRASVLLEEHNLVVLNGQEVVRRALLRVGDVLEIGTQTLTVHPLVGWLDCPPLSPVALGPDLVVEIGRAPSCQLVLRDPRVSRRQGVVHVDPATGALRYEHEGSQRSFVNGVPAPDEAVLAMNDVISFGSYEITVRPPEFAYADLTLDERTNTEQLRTGHLSRTPMSELLQDVALHSKTGSLRVQRGELWGTLNVQDGQLLSASWGELRDDEAVLAMLELRDGRFVMSTELIDATPRMRTSVTALLLEASRRLDQRATDAGSL